LTADEAGRPVEGEGEEKREAHVFGFVVGRERTRWK